VAAREQEPFTNSGRLVELLYDAVPAATRRTGGHPAKRTFQALRIEVNGELEVLRRAMPAALGALPVGGRIVVEAYQSLEDRLVKQALAELAKSRTPEGLPVELPGHGPELKLLTRGAEKAGEEEIGRNPRAASVRLRAAERIGEPR
jgi:16S rRNA (cytosine1402-N4)-methyltransferase